MRLTSRGRVRALALLCTALAGGCTTTVDGTGTIAADSTVRPGGGGAPSGSAAASETETTSPSGQPTRESLACPAGKLIKPSGAPYCFTVPGGFTDVSKSVTVGATIGSERFRSAVAVNRRDRDLIIVTTYELRLDSDPIADAVLERELQGVLGQLSKRGFSFDSTTAKRVSVDGARGFGYHATEPRNRLQADVYFAFRGRTELEVNCQWRDAPGDVRRGCQSVLSSMQFTTVG